MNIFNIIFHILRLSDIFTVFDKNYKDISDIPLNEYKFSNPESDTDLHAFRKGNSVHLSGKLNNKVYVKAYNIDGSPWYQDWPTGIKNEINSGKEKFLFWSIDPDKLKIARFKGRVLEKISLNNQLYDIIYVKITLTGIQRLFWKGMVFKFRITG